MNLLLLLLTPLLTTVTLALSTPNPHLEATHWANLQRFNLPRTLSSLSPHPLPRRKALYRLLDQPTQDALWREHLALYTTTHADTLTPAQSALIARADAWLDDKNEAVKTELYRAAVYHFGKEEAGRVFATLGEEGLGEGPNGASGGGLVRRAKDCNCSTSEDFCGGDDQCRGQGCGKCQVIRDECGWFYTDDCNGRCYNPEVSC